MEEEFYKVYCSKCNSEMKKKMSWTKYIKYISCDGRSKGYHQIPFALLDKTPTACPFGHPVKREMITIVRLIK